MLTIDRYLKATIIVLSCAAAPFALSACDQESELQQEMQETGNQIDDTAEAAGDAMQEGARKTAEEAEQAVENLQDESQ